MNALLICVEDIRASSKKFNNQNLASDWTQINTLLCELYMQDDPDFAKEQDIEKGMMIAQKIKQIM